MNSVYERLAHDAVYQQGMAGTAYQMSTSWANKLRSKPEYNAAYYADQAIWWQDEAARRYKLARKIFESLDMFKQGG